MRARAFAGERDRDRDRDLTYHNKRHIVLTQNPRCVAIHGIVKRFTLHLCNRRQHW